MDAKRARVDRRNRTAGAMAVAVVLAVWHSAPSFAAGDPDHGAKVYRQCMICHSIGPGAQNKIGPELNGLDGRKAGTVANFSYSDANKNSGIVWSEVTFKDYIKDPRAKVPGTKMIFAGVKNQQQVNDLWAYVSQFDADGNVKK